MVYLLLFPGIFILINCQCPLRPYAALPISCKIYDLIYQMHDIATKQKQLAYCTCIFHQYKAESIQNTGVVATDHNKYRKSDRKELLHKSRKVKTINKMNHFGIFLPYLLYHGGPASYMLSFVANCQLVCKLPVSFYVT